MIPLPNSALLNLSNLPPRKSQNFKESRINSIAKNSLSTDRFIPNRESTLGGIGAALITKNQELPLNPTQRIYQRHLAGRLLGSEKPWEEPVLHYSPAPTSALHPYRPLAYETYSLLNDTLESPKAIYDLPYSLPPVNDLYYHVLSLSPHGNRFAVCDRDDGVYVVPFPSKDALESEPFLLEFNLDPNEVVQPISVTFSPDESFLIVCLSNERIIRCNLGFEDSKLVNTLLDWTSSEIPSLSNSPIAISKEWVHVGTKDGSILNINSLNPNDRHSIKGSSTDAAICEMLLSPDQNTLIAGTTNGILKVFNLETRKLLHEIKVSHTAVKAIAFSPCGRYFAIGGSREEEPTISVWKRNNLSVKKLYENNADSQLTSLFWSDRLLVSMHEDGNLRLFNINPTKTPIVSDPVLRKIHDPQFSFATFCDQGDHKMLFIGCPDMEQLIRWEILPFPSREKRKRAEESESIFRQIR